MSRRLSLSPLFLSLSLDITLILVTQECVSETVVLGILAPKDSTLCSGTPTPEDAVLIHPHQQDPRDLCLDTPAQTRPIFLFLLITRGCPCTHAGSKADLAKLYQQFSHEAIEDENTVGFQNPFRMVSRLAGLADSWTISHIAVDVKCLATYILLYLPLPVSHSSEVRRHRICLNVSWNVSC